MGNQLVEQASMVVTKESISLRAKNVILEGEDNDGQEATLEETESPEQLVCDSYFRDVQCPTYLPDKQLFPTNGIMLSRMEVFVNECGGRSSLGWLTTAEVNKYFVIPFTAEKKCSYCDLLVAEGAECVGTAQVYISHSWEYVFVDVVDALLYHFRDNPDIIIWFDLFSNNQYDASDIELDHWCTTQCNHTVLILSPWSNPKPRARSWTLLDIYFTMVSGCRLEIAMRPSDREYFMEELLKSTVKTIDESLACVKGWIEKCLYTWYGLYWTADNRKLICNDISNALFKCMYNWIRFQFKVLIDGGDDIALAQKCLGIIYLNSGKRREAGVLLKAAVDTYSVSKHDVTALMLLSNYLLLLYRMKKYDEALPICKQCFEISLLVQGYKCIYTRKAMFNLVCLYYRLGKYEDAVSLLVNFLEHKEEGLGALADKHYDTFQAMNYLSILYKKMGRNDDAIEYLKESIAIRKDILGEDHPYTLTSLGYLWSLYHIAGRVDDAQHLLRDMTFPVSNNSGEI